MSPSTQFAQSPGWPWLCLLAAASFSLPLLPAADAQCVGRVESLQQTARCTADLQPTPYRKEMDAQKAWTLVELMDLAESNHPKTRIAWEQARQAAEALGAVRSEYLPRLAGLALLENQKLINPFPKPLATNGYTMVEMPVADAGLAVHYTILDFGRRQAHLEQAKAAQLAAAAHFQRENQDVAFAVVTAFYRLVNAQETLAARTQILKTAETIQSAAEAQLANGRATLPDLLDAKAGSARAGFEMEAARGEEQSARVALRESLGVEPSDQIQIAVPQTDVAEVSASIAALLQTAQQQRPDLAALAERVRASEDAVQAARSSYLPTVEFEAKGSAQSIWPTVSRQDGSSLGDTTQFVWNAGVSFHWDFFDGGRRRSEVLQRSSEERQEREELRERQDEVARATWTAWVQLRTAQRQVEAAQALLQAAQSSYDASLEAYGYGVKNLIDLVHAEQQLAEARLSDVQARSALLTSVARLGYTTGTLLNNAPTARQP